MKIIPTRGGIRFFPLRHIDAHTGFWNCPDRMELFIRAQAPGHMDFWILKPTHTER